MKKGIMICAGIVGILTACEQTEIREITEDRYVPQPVDTVKVTDNYYLDGTYRRRLGRRTDVASREPLLRRRRAVCGKRSRKLRGRV